MRLALFVLALFIVALAATANADNKRQINQYLPYYGPTYGIEPRQLRPTRTITVTQTSTVLYTITCVKSTTACPSSTTTTSTTTPSTSTSINPTPTSSTPTTTPSSSTPTTTPSSSSSSTTPSSSSPSTTPSSSSSSTTPSSSSSSTTPSSSSSSARTTSDVQGKEATVREVRDADQFPYPRRLEMMPPFGYYHPQEIQSGFDNDPTFALPYYGSFVQPAAIAQPRIFFGALNAFFPRLAVTKTETVKTFTFIATTSTLLPTCLPPGVLQCAA